MANCLDKFGITLATGGNVLDVLKAMKAQNLEGLIGGAYYYEIPSSPPRYPSAGRPGRGHPSNRCNGMPLGTERGRCSQNRWTRRSKRAHVWPKTRHAALRIPEKRKGEQLVLLTERRNAARGELLEQAKTEGVSELHVPRHLVGTATIPLLGAGKTDDAVAQALVEKELNIPKDRPGEGPAG